MLGGNPGWVVNQGEILAELFRRDGYEVKLTSTRPRRAARLADTIASILSWRKRVDVVVVHVFSGLGFHMADVSSLATRAIRKPLVLALHGGDLPSFAERKPAWIRRVLSRADHLVAPSPYLAETFRQLGFDVTVIPNVLEMDLYPFKQREMPEPSLLWMRTFHELYDPLLALEALAHLARDHPDATLTMAGQEKGMLDEVRRAASKAGLDDRIRFLGFLGSEDKQREFATHDVFLNTNRVDNMPVSVIEAAAFGLPIVATNVGGIPYLLEDEETALLVPYREPEAMAAAVDRLVREPGLAKHLSAQGRRLAERSSWTAVRRGWEEVFADLGALRP
jgi:glycosyltransferase involved in cell wall biosynthesis